MFIYYLHKVRYMLSVTSFKKIRHVSVIADVRTTRWEQG